MPIDVERGAERPSAARYLPPDAPVPERAGAASTALWSLLFALFSAAILTIAFETAMHFSGVAIDGPFQLYNALRRIQAGFRPGVDFQFFHGLGIPYLHYLPYRLFGGGLEGSELAREMTAAAAFPAVYLLALRAFTGTWRRALALSAAALALSFVLHMSAVIFALNSMLGVRSALPTLLPAVLYLSASRRTRAIAGGVTLGLSLFLSTEQGLAVSAAYLLVALIAIIVCKDRRGTVLEAVATVAIAGACLVTCLVAVGGIAGMRGALRYNFEIIPHDQYWYFGAPPNVFVSSWGDAARLASAFRPITAAVVLALVAAGVYVRRLSRSADDESVRRNFALALLAVYGLASCGSLLGIFTLAYAQPCWRVVIIVGFIELARVGWRKGGPPAARAWLGVPRAAAAVSVLCALWAVTTIPLIRTALGASLPHVVADHFVGGAGFGIAGIWPETLERDKSVVDAHRGPNGAVPVIWSTYAGWLEALHGVFHPSTDYIIHALGPENRQAYVERFRAARPAIVQTVRPTYTQYEGWLENEDWAFYDAVLDSYRATALTPWSIFWEPRSTPAPPLQLIGVMTAPPGIASVPLPPFPAPASAAAADSTMLLEVEIEYATHNALRALPIIGATPRFLVMIDGALSRMPVSLDPFVHRIRFPIVVRRGQQPSLRFQTFSLLPGAWWTPRSLKVWVRPLDESTQLWFSDLVQQLAPTRGN